MKNLFLTASLSCILLAACAQTTVPSAVSDAFQQKFPGITPVWEKEGIYYQAEYRVGLAEHEVKFDSSGQMIKYEQDITESELPQAVKDALKTHFSAYIIEEIRQIEAQGVITYKADLESAADDDIDVTFSADGTILKQED